MSSLATISEQASPLLAYHLLKVAGTSYKKNPAQLAPEQLQEATEKARQTYEIESLVMATDEARKVVISDSQLDGAVDELKGRYQSAEEFEQDLQQNNLDEELLRDSLRRELVFDSVMQQIGARSVDVNDLDIHLFYEMHHDRFDLPEKRVARHILITINPDYIENSRPAALARAEQLVGKLRGRKNRFASLARKYSECPTALEGGKLGTLTRGQLYPELDAMLFSMQEGEISGVVESDVGFHVLWCEKVIAAKSVPLSKARPRIRQLLEERKRRNCQKNWLAELRRSNRPEMEPS